MSSIQQLNLTEKDFELIVDGLDCLPNKNSTGELMSGLLGSMLLKDDTDAKIKFEREQKERQIKADRQKQLLTEEIRILQGKLLMLKRFLIEQGALTETNNIINHFK